MADTSKSTLPSEEEIRLRAYEIYLARGREDGRDFEDWIEAQRQLSGLSEQQASSTQKARSAVAGQRG